MTYNLTIENELLLSANHVSITILYDAMFHFTLLNGVSYSYHELSVKTVT